MAYPKKALGEAEVRSMNLKSINLWIETNKKFIAAKSGKTVLYAGVELDADVIGGLSPADRETFKGMRMFELIKKWNKQKHDLKVPCDFQTLGDVLTGISHYPKFVARDHHEPRFAHACHFFNDLKDERDLVPSSTYDACWKKLSEIYANNAKGHIEILDGLSEEYRMLSKEKILINTELKALLNNHKQLSPDGKKKLLEKVTKYGKEFDHRYTPLIKSLDAEVSQLKHPKRL